MSYDDPSKAAGSPLLIAPNSCNLATAIAETTPGRVLKCVESSAL